MNKTPKCDAYEDLRKYFLEDLPDGKALASLSAAYKGLLRLARKLETELTELKE